MLHTYKNKTMKKALQKIDLEIKEILSIGITNDKRTDNKNNRALAQLRSFRMYVEKSPSIDFIKSEIGRVENLICKIQDTRKDFVPSTKNADSEFRSATGLTELNKQLKNLRIILSYCS